ncbi:MAG TPA: hypothetical protein VLH13_03695 [Methanomassiliicoccales archaeon]|nr:hypothetical protein [Methanomassiliicoccales archaeon]
MKKWILRLGIYGMICMFLLAVFPMAAGAPAWDVKTALNNLQNSVDQILDDTSEIKEKVGNLPTYEYGSETFIFTLGPTPDYQEFHHTVALTNPGPFKMMITFTWMGGSLGSDDVLFLTWNQDGWGGSQTISRGEYIGVTTLEFVSGDGESYDLDFVYVDMSPEEGKTLKIEYTYIAEVYAWEAA